MLQNLNWNPTFMHDGGILNIEVMPFAPITNPIEMNETMTNLLKHIKEKHPSCLMPSALNLLMSWICVI